MNSVEQMAQSLRTLMVRLEGLLVILHQQQFVYWADWGTLLGVERHRNVIPWDYDVDICMPAEDYQKLIIYFESCGGQVGDLVLAKDYYEDPQGAFAILFADVPDGSLGIDVVSYHRDGERLLNDMSPQLQADYPGNYDFPTSQVLPLRWGHLLGQPVLQPAQSVARLEELFGDWQAFPPDQQASALTEPPFAVIPDTTNANGPSIVRSPRSEADGWAQPGYVAGTRVLRWVAATDAQAQQLTVRDLQENTFTDLVYRNDRGLWGKVWVGTLFPGDTWSSDVPGVSAEGPCFGSRDGG